eukprot:3040173-Pyramimonas_sp.AAC.1
MEPAWAGMWGTPTRYYQKDGYGILIAAECSLQNASRMAKSFAFCTHAVDVDQEDSHKRHLLNLLDAEGFLDAEGNGFCMIPLR